MKVETWLRMANVPFETRELGGAPRSKTKKIPYIDRPDGSVLSDSSTIISTLSRERAVDLDAELSDQQQALGVLVQRTFEEHLYFTLLHDRWVDDAGWKLTGPAYFGHFPLAMRIAMLPLIRRGVIRQSWEQGVGRLPKELIHARGVRDLSALSTILAGNDYFLGPPSSVDAIAYAFLANVIEPPLPSPVAAYARGKENLVAYCARMKERYYAEILRKPT
jgi:glutathione S-transferase